MSVTKIINNEDNVWMQAELYMLEMTEFNAREFIDHVKQFKRNTQAIYFILLNDKFHKDDFFKDLQIFSNSFKSGQRPEDVVEENRHLMKEYIEELKKESINFTEMAVQSLMPIRYYFKEEMVDIVNHTNLRFAEELKLTGEELRRHEFRLHF